MGGYAWVTLATNDAYSLGALVLAHSLRRVGTKYEMAILVTPGVTEMMRSKLAAVFSVVQEVNVLDSKDKANLALLARPELGITFTKLHCWRLTQYDKCVFLDADTLVVRNCDELFEREELSAAPDVGWPDCFNSGVFVYRPSQQTFSSITAFAAAKGSFDGGDQGLLNMYFSDWAQKDISKHLPFIYNVCSTAAYSYLPAFKQFGEDVRIIHFIGITKPWLQYFDTLTGIVQPPPNCNHLQPLLQLWWNLFCEKVHPQLSPVMASSTLAPIWHQYNPTQFHSSAPRAPSNYTHMDDVYNDIHAQKPDFSEFKDPWDEYCAQNTHYTQTNVENNSNNQYYCNNQNNERSQPSNSYTEQKSEHYNENQCQECQFSSEKWHSPPQEQQQQYNAPCINNTQQHVFIQRENEACNVHFVEQSQPNYHDTHHRIDHSISSNGTQQHSFSHEQHVEQFHSHNNGHSHHDQNQHNQNHMKNDYSYANNVSHHERREDVDHQQHCNIHYQHTPEPPSVTQHQYHEQHSNIVHHNHEHYSSPPEQYSHVESNERYNNDACMNAKNSERENRENEVCQWQTSPPNHERDHRDVERQTDTQNSTSSPESIPCTESHKIATQSEPNVTEHLDSSSAGLAGALAKMTLGEPRSAEQIALEEHMRKQSWEHGQIDYMGRDSFDNIWKKICETLSLAPTRTSPPKEIPSSSEEQTEKADNKEQEEVEIPKAEAAANVIEALPVLPDKPSEQISVQQSDTKGIPPSETTEGIPVSTLAAQCETNADLIEIVEKNIENLTLETKSEECPIGRDLEKSLIDSQSELLCVSEEVSVSAVLEGSLESSENLIGKEIILVEKDVIVESCDVGKVSCEMVKQEIPELIASCDIVTTQSEPVTNIESTACPVTTAIQTNTSEKEIQSTVSTEEKKESCSLPTCALKTTEKSIASDETCKLEQLPLTESSSSAESPVPSTQVSSSDVAEKEIATCTETQKEKSVTEIQVAEAKVAEDLPAANQESLSCPVPPVSAALPETTAQSEQVQEVCGLRAAEDTEKAELPVKDQVKTVESGEIAGKCTQSSVDVGKSSENVDKSQECSLKSKVISPASQAATETGILPEAVETESSSSSARKPSDGDKTCQLANVDNVEDVTSATKSEIQDPTTTEVEQEQKTVVAEGEAAERESVEASEADATDKKPTKKVVKKVLKKTKSKSEVTDVPGESSSLPSKQKKSVKVVKKSAKQAQSPEANPDVPESPVAGGSDAPIPPKRKTKTVTRKLSSEKNQM